MNNWILTAALATALLAPLAAPSAQELIRVRLPNGQYLSLDNGEERPWYRDPRVSEYRNWYWDAPNRVYVVKDDKFNSHFCPPGQAKKGRC